MHNICGWIESSCNCIDAVLKNLAHTHLSQTCFLIKPVGSNFRKFQAKGFFFPRGRTYEDIPNVIH